MSRHMVRDVLAHHTSAGGGTRTPDTRIMMALERYRRVRGVTGFASYSAKSAPRPDLAFRAESVAYADTLLTPPEW
jgi:hypothetical protein